MTAFQCTRCGKTAPRLPGPPMPGEMGKRLYEHACGDCWKAWLQHQTALINHYGLNLREPRAKEFLASQTEAFFFEARQPDGA